MIVETLICTFTKFQMKGNASFSLLTMNEKDFIFIICTPTQRFAQCWVFVFYEFKKVFSKIWKIHTVPNESYHFRADLLCNISNSESRGRTTITSIPRFSYWRLRVSPLVEVPIGNQENAKTRQVNKLWIVTVFSQK